MESGDRVVVNAPGGFLHGRQGVVAQVSGEYAGVLIGENVYMIMDIALEPAPPADVCPVCGAALPGMTRREGE